MLNRSLNLNLNLSVAICTYNGETRLPWVMERLRSQLNPAQVNWEILIVDNNSSDKTSDRIVQFQSDWAEDPNLPKIHSLFERSQGTAFARQTALMAAKGEWVAFLDDDNLPHENWISTIVDFIQHQQQIENVGAFHGKILGDYETPPPPHFDRIAPFWAIAGGQKARCYTKDPNAAKKRLLPPGAGIVVHRQAWLDHVPTKLNLVGRVGRSMVGGEDIEAMGYLSRAGFEIWYIPEIQLDHRITADRLTADCIIRHMHGIGLGRWQLRRLGIPGWKRPLAIVMFWINDGQKMLRHWVKYQRELRSSGISSGISSNVVTKAEWAFFKGCLQSPFYRWMR